MAKHGKMNLDMLFVKITYLFTQVFAMVVACLKLEKCISRICRIRGLFVNFHLMHIYDVHSYHPLSAQTGARQVPASIQSIFLIYLISSLGYWVYLAAGGGFHSIPLKSSGYKGEPSAIRCLIELVYWILSRNRPEINLHNKPAMVCLQKREW